MSSVKLSAARLVDEFLRAVEGENATALSSALGIDASHISRWRRGYRPERLNPSTAASLRAALEATHLGAGSSSTHGPAHSDGHAHAIWIAVGEFRAIQRMAGDLATLAGDAGRRLSTSMQTAPRKKRKGSGRP